MPPKAPQGSMANPFVYSYDDGAKTYVYHDDVGTWWAETHEPSGLVSLYFTQANPVGSDGKPHIDNPDIDWHKVGPGTDYPDAEPMGYVHQGQQDAGDDSPSYEGRQPYSDFGTSEDSHARVDGHQPYSDFGTSEDSHARVEAHAPYSDFLAGPETAADGDGLHLDTTGVIVDPSIDVDDDVRPNTEASVTGLPGFSGYPHSADTQHDSDPSSLNDQSRLDDSVGDFEQQASDWSIHEHSRDDFDADAF